MAGRKGEPLNPAAYVTYRQVESQAVQYYKRYGNKTGFREIVDILSRKNLYHENRIAYPKVPLWSSLDDAAFKALLYELPVRILDPELLLKKVPNEIAAEQIMPSSLEVFAILYVRDIVEKLHVHNFFEIDYVLSGKCQMIFENERRELKEGEITIIAPDSMHDLTVSDDSTVVSFMLRQDMFENTFFALLSQENPLSSFFRTTLYSGHRSANYILFETDNSRTLNDAVKDIFMESYLSDSFSGPCIISRVLLFFSLLLRGYSGSIQLFDSANGPDAHADFISVLQYLQRHYQTTDLPALATRFHYNPSYLSRMIRSKTGQTLSELKESLRISRAETLLRQTRLKVEDIAAAVGYENTDHFSRTFKRKYGISPREYRRKNGPG